MDEVHSVACVDFLVEGTGACVLLGGLDIVFLVGSSVSSGMFWCVCELSMPLASLSANGLGCFPVLLVVWHGASSTGACWPLGGVGSVLRRRSLGEL